MTDYCCLFLIVCRASSFTWHTMTTTQQKACYCVHSASIVGTCLLECIWTLCALCGGRRPWCPTCPTSPCHPTRNTRTRKLRQWRQSGTSHRQRVCGRQRHHKWPCLGPSHQGKVKASPCDQPKVKEPARDSEGKEVEEQQRH